MLTHHRPRAHGGGVVTARRVATTPVLPHPSSSASGEDVALAVEDLVVTYGGKRDPLHAVDHVSFSVRRGRTLGVIGESGSGKSTLAKAVAGLVPVSDGQVRIAPRGGALAPAAASVGRDSQVQMIFQDPTLALNPGRAIWESVAEPLEPRRFRLPRRLRESAIELLEQVGLDRSLADRRPDQLSGGQCQRVTIARAVAGQAPVVMCDEPVAALDISLQAGVLRLLDSMRTEHDLTYVVISHDMTSIARLADDVAVMYLGQLVEVGPVRDVLREPRHPYTQALIRAIPRVSLEKRDRTVLIEGEIPDARNPPSGCRFRTRCPFTQELCAREQPFARTPPPAVGTDVDPPATVDASLSSQHRTACHFWQEIRNGVAPVTRGLHTA